MREDHSSYLLRSDSISQREDSIVNKGSHTKPSHINSSATTKIACAKSKNSVSLKTIIIVSAILIVLVSVVSFVAGKTIAEKQAIKTLAGYDDSVSDNMLLGNNTEDAEIKEELEKAMNLAADSNYLMAIITLNSITDKSPEAKALLAEYTQRYENHIVEEANVLKGNNNLDEAVALVSDALKVLPDSIVLSSKHQELKKCLPQKLLAVAPSYQSGGNQYKEYSYSSTGGTEYFSMGGIKYTDGMTFNADVNIFDDVSWAVYNLNGEYNTLEFTVGHVDGTFNGDKNSLQIFCDGELKEEISLAPDMIPKAVSLDVSGVVQLKMQVHASGADNPEYGVGNPMIKQVAG